jgi:RHS repeat-associated protein
LTRYTYTGREFDADTGLMYYRARWYDPQVGRFISEDPIGFRGRDVNFYGYVKNGPLLFRDPSGLQRCDPIVGMLLGAGAGGVFGILGGTVAGPPVGAVLGAITFAIAGPAGSGAGAAFGAAAGATAGPVVGGGIGAGIGAYVGYRSCSGGNSTCDSVPQAPPIPYPAPRSIPFLPPPPPLQMGRGWTCEASCNTENFSNIPNAPARVRGIGFGSSEEDACRSAKAAAVATAPRGTYGRHCKCFNCIKN